MQSVLLLNASYEPLGVISWQRAVTLFFCGKVEVVDAYDQEIRSVSLVIKAPSIVRLLKFIRIPGKNPPLCKANVMARDNFQCQYCEQRVTAEDATLDHVTPRSQKGLTTWENIVCCCRRCNKKKGGKTPQQAGMALVSKPVKPAWLPVFRIKLHGQMPLSWNSFIRS